MHRASWGVAQAVIDTAKAALKADKIPVLKEDKVSFVFLYAKGVLAFEHPELRKLEFTSLANPENAGLASKYYAKARKRLRKLVPAEDEEGDVSKDRLPLNVQSLHDFLNAFPVWNGPDAFICPEVRLHLVQRVQQSGGLCYFNAPVVLQHYLVARNVGAHTGMIDMAKYIRKHYSAKQLYNHIFRDVGENSILSLDSVLQEGSRVVRIGVNAVDKNQLEKFGPHLLSMFEVHDDFMYGDQLSYRGAPSVLSYRGARPTLFKPGHAMVIVGVRTMEDGSKMFLLQNWWAKKQFVEVVEAYIKACEVEPCFVETPQTGIPTMFDTISKMYVETTMDKDDTYPKEGPC